MGTLEIDAIRNYLLQVGCKIEYPILVNAFKQHLYNPDPQLQGKIRTQFKDYVNRLATVSLENNMKFINLRPEFRPTTQEPSDMNGYKSAPPPKPLTQASQPAVEIRAQQQPVVSPPPPRPPHQNNHPAMSRQHQQIMNTNHSSNSPIQHPQISAQTHASQRHQAPQPKPQTPKLKQPPIPAALKPQPPQQPQQQPPQHQPNHYKQQQQHIFTPPRPPSEYSNNHQMQSPKQINYQHHHQLHQRQSSQPIAHMPDQTPPVATRSNSLQRPESLNLSATSSQMPPPRPPPRRRLSTASLFKSSPRPTFDKAREVHDLVGKTLIRVKEHALKLSSSVSSSDLNNTSTPKRNHSMKENKLSRDYSSISGSLSSVLQRNGSHATLQRNGSHATTRSRSSHRSDERDESDSSSLQPMDALKRKWVMEACSCNYNGLVSLLREDPKLAGYKDIVNGYTALHWAAKFGNCDIINLMAGTHGVSPNTKSSAGYTPLHLACMFQKAEAMDLLMKSYKANFNIRDHSGKRPMQYWQKQLS